MTCREVSVSVGLHSTDMTYLFIYEKQITARIKVLSQTTNVPEYSIYCVRYVIDRI